MCQKPESGEVWMVLLVLLGQKTTSQMDVAPCCYKWDGWCIEHWFYRRCPGDPNDLITIQNVSFKARTILRWTIPLRDDQIQSWRWTDVEFWLVVDQHCLRLHLSGKFPRDSCTLRALVCAMHCLYRVHALLCTTLWCFAFWYNAIC